MSKKRMTASLKPTMEGSETDIQDKLSGVSSSPGVYLMKDADGTVIYVGKARNLKKRLASYFKKISPGHPVKMDIKTEIIVQKISDFEIIITGTEKEALILESNLIKRFRPRYNVILKDGKQYPSLRLDIKNPYPNLKVVRKIKKDGGLYFGPFASSAAVQQTLKIIHKTFKLRKCKTEYFKHRSRPCLNYQMDACLAPCCLDVDKHTYGETVHEVIQFLKGKTPDLIEHIKKKMTAAAEVQDYERAAVLRDKMFALEQTLEKQVAVTNDFVDRDVIGMARSDDAALITLLFIRNGFFLGIRDFIFSETMSTENEITGSFIRQYYEKAPFVPNEILVPSLPEDTLLLEELLGEIKGRRVKIYAPKRGEKVCLVQRAYQNARNSLKAHTAMIADDVDLLSRIRNQLRMDRIPWRIECFDISNISGKSAVAGMVVFEKGKPNKSLYRKYKLWGTGIPDDYALMAEALKRRYGKGKQSKPYPDMLLVDGGKGQLNVAVAVITSLRLEQSFSVISIAKKNDEKGETQDKIFKPGQANPVNLGRRGDLLLFLEKIRNEAHQYTISFHRKHRRKTFLHSALDSIPGIGQKRKKTLLTHFKSIKKIRTATLEELCALPGFNRKTAENVKRTLK